MHKTSITLPILKDTSRHERDVNDEEVLDTLMKWTIGVRKPSIYRYIVVNKRIHIRLLSPLSVSNMSDLETTLHIYWE